jgi:DNA-binding CsgD family transcriptional regulator
MRVKFANTCARILLGQGDGLVAQAGGVSAHHLDDAIRLQLIVQRVIERGGAADTEIPVVSVRRVGRRPLVATVVGTSRRALQPADAAAILFVLDPEQDVLRMLGASCGLYGLTETESRLTKHLVSGLTVTEAAAAMRIQCATARAYLKQIFAKTGTHRQTDLVRLMLLSVVRMPGTVQFHAVG